MNWVKIFPSQATALEKISDKSIKGLKYKEKKYCVIRFKDKFYVTEALCPHQNASLIDGKLNDFGEIICPLHEYRFSLIENGRCHTNCKDLIIYPSRQDNDGVYFIPE